MSKRCLCSDDGLVVDIASCNVISDASYKGVLIFPENLLDKI